MAKSAAPALALAGLASVLVISGIQGESLADVVKGNFGKRLNPKGPEKNPEEQILSEGRTEGQTTGPVVPKNLYGKFISPFPKTSNIQWGRSDQGVDGIAPPGTPLLAMGNGVVTIGGPDPNGFGVRYPVLHIDNDGSYYYGHTEPIVTGRVHAGEIIARANTNGQGNAHTPGAFEIGKWPPGSFTSAGAEIRSWLMNLPRL